MTVVLKILETRYV